MNFGILIFDDCVTADFVLAAREIKISMDGNEAWRENVFVERLWRNRPDPGVADAPLGRRSALPNPPGAFSRTGSVAPHSPWTLLLALPAPAKGAFAAPPWIPLALPARDVSPLPGTAFARPVAGRLTAPRRRAAVNLSGSGHASPRSVRSCHCTLINQNLRIRGLLAQFCTLNCNISTDCVSGRDSRLCNDFIGSSGRRGTSNGYSYPQI